MRYGGPKSISMANSMMRSGKLKVEELLEMT